MITLLPFRVLLPLALLLSCPAAAEDDLAALRRESIEESLRLLPLDGLDFYLPSLMAVEISTPIALPLHESVLQRDLTRILYNPRFRKLLAELRCQDSGAAREALISAIHEAKAMFDRLYAASVSERGHLFAEASLEASAALGAEVWSDASSTPTLAGVRLGLLGLLILAADIGLTDAAPLITKYAIEAQASRNHFYREENGNLRARVSAVGTGLYHPQILITAMQSLAPLPESPGSNGRRSLRDTTVIRLTPFDKLGAPAIAASGDSEAIELSLSTGTSDSEFDKHLSRLTQQSTSLSKIAR